MSFRTIYVAESSGTCLCPFHEKILPVFNHVVPNDVTHAEIYHLRGFSGKKVSLAIRTHLFSTAKVPIIGTT